MEILSNPTQNYREQLEEILRDEIKRNIPNGIGIMNLGSDMETGHYVVLEDDKPVAVATMQNGDEIYKLYVHPEYRKRHVADKLIKHVMAELKNNEEESLFIEMTRESLNFWGKFVQENKLEYQEVPGQLKIFIKLN